MQTLQLTTGDLIQIKTADLPNGKFIKLQPQSVSFLERITDPKAVLENVLRNFSTLTVGDIFQFLYNDETFDVAVLEVKPDIQNGAISCVETDLEVDFAAPLDYVEPIRGPPSTGSSRPGSVVGGGRVTPVTEGSMSRNINYSAIAPGSAASSTARSAFSGAGQKLKGSKTSTPVNKPSTPVGGTSSNPGAPPTTVRRGNGPQPLRLPHGKLFFGYEIRPVKNKDEKENAEKKPSMFSAGGGQTLRGAGGKKRKGDASSSASSNAGSKGKPDVIEID